MPITSSSIFDTVVLSCQCEYGVFGGHQVQQGRSARAGADDLNVLPLPDILSPTNVEVAEVISRVQAGTVKAYYADSVQGVWAPAENAPFEFWQFHGRHPFWQEDGYKMLDRLATKGDLEETTNGRHFEFEGGFFPQRTAVASSTVAQSLADWRANRNGQVVGFRISVPVADEITAATITTWPAAKAMRDWLESLRVMGTGDELGDSLSSSWPSGVQFDLRLSDTNTLRLGNPRTSTTRTSDGFYLSVWLIFDTVSGDPDLDQLNSLLQATSVNIPGAGMMQENPWGNTEVRGSVRDLAMSGGRIEMANGFPIAHFRDPIAGADERSIPFGGGFGRTVQYQNLPSHTGSARRIAYPEEIPFLNNIHCRLVADGDLHFNDLTRIVGFAGADRSLVIENRGTAGTHGDVTIKDWMDRTVLILRPGEASGFIASLSDYGEAELRAFNPPFRRMIHDATASANVATNYYEFVVAGGANYWLRPFVRAGAPIPLYEDEDAFGFGTGTLTDGTVYSAANYVSTPEAVVLKHGGDLVIYAEIECEVTQAGSLPASHSAVILRKRGNTVNLFNIDSQPELTGINTSRTYSVFYWAEAEVGDEYQVMLLYPQAATLNIAEGLRVVDYRRFIRLAPKIEVS